MPKFIPVPHTQEIDLQKNRPEFVTLHIDELSRLVGRAVKMSPDGVPLISDQENKFVQNILSIRDRVLKNPDLRDDHKHAIAASLKESVVSHTTAPARRAIDKAMLDIELDKRNLAAKKELVEWLYAPLVLRRPGSCVTHKLLDYVRGDPLLIPAKNDAFDEDGRMTVLFEKAQVFVVEHDWAAAFAGAKDADGGELKLPFECCVFEFNISGRPVVVEIGESNDTRWSCMVLAETQAGWACVWIYDFLDGQMTPIGPHSWAQIAQPMADMIGRNIRAIAIALDAEVAATTIVRAPHKLNRARERRGKSAIMDYHVVSLARRSRAERLPQQTSVEPTRRVRLHFRRGHWRHFDDHKTWIKWTLVGDPDLGFIDKHYKL